MNSPFVHLAGPSSEPVDERTVEQDARLLASQAFALATLLAHLDKAHFGGRLQAGGVTILASDLYGLAERVAGRLEREARR